REFLSQAPPVVNFWIFYLGTRCTVRVRERGKERPRAQSRALVETLTFAGESGRSDHAQPSFHNEFHEFADCRLVSTAAAQSRRGKSHGGLSGRLASGFFMFQKEMESTVDGRCG
ncbi:unnamed protein product, partial [Scytosiphon promiscuus]